MGRSSEQCIVCIAQLTAFDNVGTQALLRVWKLRGGRTSSMIAVVDTSLTHPSLDRHVARAIVPEGAKVASAVASMVHLDSLFGRRRLVVFRLV
jgi:hypothetical protein